MVDRNGFAAQLDALDGEDDRDLAARPGALDATQRAVALSGFSQIPLNRKPPDSQTIATTSVPGERPPYWDDLPDFEKNKSPKDRTVSVLSNPLGLLPYIRAGVEARNRGESFWGGTPQYERQRKALQQYYNDAYEAAPDSVKVLSQIGLPGGPLTQAAKAVAAAEKPVVSAVALGGLMAGTQGYLAPVEPAPGDVMARLRSAGEAIPFGVAMGVAGGGIAKGAQRALAPREDVIEQIAAQINGEFDPAHALIVREAGDGYEIISGHHRALAAQKAGLTEVPCWVREMSDEDAYMALALCNAQGELNELEVGMHARGSGLSGRAYADKVGKPHRTIADRIQAAEVAEACADIRTAEMSAQWSALAALHSAPRWLWRALVSRLVSEGWTVETARREAQKLKETGEPPKWANREAIADAIARLCGLP